MRRLPLSLALAALIACSDPEPAPAPLAVEAAPPVSRATREAPREEAPAPDEAAPAAAPEAPIPEDVEALLRELAEPTRCNRLTGCAPGEAIQRQGRRAVPGLIALCRHSSGDRYWREQAFALIGILGGLEAESFLLEKLRDGSDRLLHSVLLAIGHARVRSDAARGALRRFQESGPTEIAALAADYALARLGSHEARARLDRALAPEQLLQQPPLVIHVGLDAVRWLDAREHAPTVRTALRHPNLFVRRQALDLVKDWRLREAVGDLIPLLEDESSGVRERALALLKRLTGVRHKHTRAQWEAWCRTDPGCELRP